MIQIIKSHTLIETLKLRHFSYMLDRTYYTNDRDAVRKILLNITQTSTIISNCGILNNKHNKCDKIKSTC